MVLGEAHEGQRVASASSMSAASFGTLGAELIGDLPPLGPGHPGVISNEGGADEGRHHATALAGVGKARCV